MHVIYRSEKLKTVFLLSMVGFSETVKRESPTHVGGVLLHHSLIVRSLLLLVANDGLHVEGVHAAAAGIGGAGRHYETVMVIQCDV